MSEIYQMKSLNSLLLESVETPSDRVRQSIEYRRKASRLGRMANAESDETKMVPLLNLALSWIQMAENEEFLIREAQDLQ